MPRGSPQLRLSSEIGQFEGVVGFFLKKYRKSEKIKKFRKKNIEKIGEIINIFEKNSMFFREISDFVFQKKSDDTFKLTYLGAQTDLWGSPRH